MCVQQHQMMKYFKFDHLPKHMQKFSQPFHDVARFMDDHLLDSAEKSAGMRKLLEAKDCFVRASMDGGTREEGVRPVTAGLTQYKSHKVVHAELMDIHMYRAMCTTEGDNIRSSVIDVKPGELDGYHIVYEKGATGEYHSWSPRTPFEAGYSAL